MPATPVTLTRSVRKKKNQLEPEPLKPMYLLNADESDKMKMTYLMNSHDI